MVSFFPSTRAVTLRQIQNGNKKTELILNSKSKKEVRKRLRKLKRIKDFKREICSGKRKGKRYYSIFVNDFYFHLSQAENTVESEADSKKEGAEHEVDLEHAVGRLRVHQTARLLLVVTLLGHVVVQGGVVEEAVRGLEGSDQAGTRGGRTEAGVWHRAWITWKQTKNANLSVLESNCNN